MTLVAATPHEKGVNRARTAGDTIMWLVCGLALAALVVPIIWIIGQVVTRAIPHFHWSFLTQPTVGNGGGLSQAVLGTLVLMAMVGVIAGVTGVGAGIYLAEYARRRSASLLRGATEVLAGVPSIIVGYVGFTALAIGLKWKFSIWAAAIALTAIVIPYITKTTELALRGVPGSFREGAEALGMRDILILRRISLRAASPGIITGLIMALAISVGETAPLLYTAFWSVHNPTFGLHNSPVGYLTYPIWTFYNYPVKSATYLATESAFFLVILVGALIIASRLVSRRLSRYMPQGQG